MSDDREWAAIVDADDVVVASVDRDPDETFSFLDPFLALGDHFRSEQAQGRLKGAGMMFGDGYAPPKGYCFRREPEESEAAE